MDAVLKQRWLKGFDRLVWVALGSLFLYRCVLPIPQGAIDPAMADVRVAASGKPVLVVFDGSRCPACFAMAPVVDQLARDYEVRRYVIDKLVPGTPQHETAFDLARRVGFDRTPTFLIADGRGRLRARITGATSYFTLRGALQEASGGS